MTSPKKSQNSKIRKRSQRVKIWWAFSRISTPSGRKSTPCARRIWALKWTTTFSSLDSGLGYANWLSSVLWWSGRRFARRSRDEWTAISLSKEAPILTRILQSQAKRKGNSWKLRRKFRFIRSGSGMSSGRQKCGRMTWMMSLITSCSR